MKKTAVLVFTLCLLLGLFAGCTDEMGGANTTKVTTGQNATTSAPMITTMETTMPDTSEMGTGSETDTGTSQP
ncbi:MAG TPA: hypothetical protein GX701_02705 [Clostridiales bacterium]|jgi:outer membrane lipoprotein-sorting protein|nr:hypothetical protein [Clostridiales bacterium]